APILGIFGGNYVPMMVEADIAKLEEYYKSFGFLDARATCERQWSPGGNEVELVFHVQEGTRYQIQDTPHVIGNKAAPAEPLEAGIKVQAHEPFEKTKIDKDVEYLKNYYGYTGRNAKVEANTVYSNELPGVVRVNYEVEEQPVIRVGQIFIAGNERTRMNVILRQVAPLPS